jgi:hypothetical protein
MLLPSFRKPDSTSAVAIKRGCNYIVTLSNKGGNATHATAHLQKLPPEAGSKYPQRYHMANRGPGNHNQDIIQAQPIVHPAVASLAQKMVAEYQLLVNGQKINSIFWTNLARQLEGLEELQLRSNTPRVVEVQKADLAATFNKRILRALLDNEDRDFLCGWPWNLRPYQVGGLLRLKVFCNCNTPPLVIPHAHRTTPFTNGRWHPDIHHNCSPSPNLHWEIECIEREILGVERTRMSPYLYTEEELKHNAVQRVVQEALRQLDRDLDTFVCDIAELEEKIARDNFLLNQRQGRCQEGVIAFGEIF